MGISSTLKQLILAYTPRWFQDLAITVFNTRQYRMRRGGAYKSLRAFYQAAQTWDAQTVAAEQQKRKTEFLDYVAANSPWYQKYKGSHDLNDYPVLTKRELVEHLDQMRTIPQGEGVPMETGGTTGSSLKVVYRADDLQERFAVLDNFRAQFGYELGKKCAWFSGKVFVREKDVRDGVLWRTDFWNNIRFYSTFHINEANFDIYWRGLCEYQPEFIVGFPSSVVEICRIAQSKGLTYPGGIKCFFPTSEAILAEHKEIITGVLGCRIADQYASSEGAHFILECTKGNLHIHPLTGIFEVVDKDMKPTDEGEMLVTSFSTRGTPLVRYKIGDRIKLSDPSKVCSCGSSFELVDSIDGRDLDYIWSPERGRVNQGNLSNCTKDCAGINSFQLIQDHENSVTVNLVVTKEYTEAQEQVFKSNLEERLGKGMGVTLKYVDHIAREKSGKFRFVKNNLAH